MKPVSYSYCSLVSFTVEDTLIIAMIIIVITGIMIVVITKIRVDKHFFVDFFPYF